MRVMIRTIAQGFLAVILAVMLSLFCGFSQGVTNYLTGSVAYAAGTAGNTGATGTGTGTATNTGTGGTGTGTGTGTGGTGTGSGSATPSQDVYYVDTVMVEYDEPDDFGVWHFLDEDWEDAAYRPLTILKKGETVQLNGWYEDNHGNQVEAADSTSQMGEVLLSWSIVEQNPDDASVAGGVVAKVDPTGKVTPMSNGSVVVRCTIADPTKYQGSAPYKDVTIVFDGQDGEYVSQVDILDEDGNVIGERWGGVTVFTDKESYSQLYVKVTWVDADGNVVREESTFNGDRISTTVTWNVGGATEPFTINEETGRLRTSQYSGNAYVVCKAVGGVGGVEVSDTANIQLDTGQYHYNPSNTLTIKVAYEERPDEIMYEKTYTYDELMSRLTSCTYNYTLMAGSRYGVISAEGWLFKDLVHLLERDSNASGGSNVIDDDDIARFSFGTNDGYDNPVSWSMLFDVDRWYYPNYDLGGSKAGGVIVPPMLAFKSNQTWGESEANPTKELDESTRFRLVFGCLSDLTMNSAYQIYYINTIMITLEGAPTIDPSGGDGDGKGGAGGGDGDSGGIGGDDTSGVAQGDNEGKSPDTTIANGGQASSAAGDTGESQAKQWRIYQMMSKNKSDIGEWDFDNPLSPFAIPGALASLIIGGIAAYASFRRRLS